MLSINEAIEKTSVLLKESQDDRSVQDLILGLQESATKLWASYINNKDNKEINKRVASALMAVMILAERLEIKDLEKIYLSRLAELKLEL